MMRIPGTKMMTNEQVYELADARSLLLKHVHRWKLHYLGHIMRQPWSNIEGSLMTGLVEGKQGLETLAGRIRPHRLYFGDSCAIILCYVLW